MAIVAKILLILLTGGLLATSAFLLLSNNAGGPQPLIQPTMQPTPTVASLPQTPSNHIIPMKKHVVQTFNNCGPASLSMLLSYFGIEKSQQELGQKLRPWQNPQGINDDKNVFLSELSASAPDFGLRSVHRRDGDMEILKHFIANDIPVLVRTYLHPGEDIGHFRIVRGYDDVSQQITQDDSYEGKNLSYSYDVFMKMWKPFNYEYVVMYPAEKEALVSSILREEMDEKVAWQNAKTRAENDLQANPNDTLALFNLSIAQFHLNDYEGSIDSFEMAEASLSQRNLWYQIEPIEAYLLVKNYDRVFSLTDRILRNNNLAFSELYVLRGRAFTELNDIASAKQEFEKAVLYNNNLTEAKDRLSRL